MLSATVFEAAASAFNNDMGRLGNDVAASAAFLANAIQQSPANVPALASMANQWGHWVVTVRQDAIGLWRAVGEEIVREASFIEQRWVRFLGFNPNAQSSANNALPNAGGAGTVHSAPAVVVPHAPSPSLRMKPMTPPPSSPPPPQEYVYLSSSGYSVNENAGTVAVYVNLFTASSETVSVNLATSNGTATSGIDYTSVNTTVVFQPGTTSQVVNVPILDDGTSDDSVGSESFTAQLSDASNAQIGYGPTSATVIIQENSSPPPPYIYISGMAWQDSNNNGTYDTGESPLSGITFTLEFEDSSEDVLSTMSTTTDPSGWYSFNIPRPPNVSLFQIFVTIPNGLRATLEDVSGGYNSLIDADGYSPVFSLTNGATTATIGAGLDYLAAPFAGDGSYSVIHDSTLTVPTANGVLANSNDPNNLPLTASLVAGPSDGTLNLNSDGSFTYTPNAGYIGSDSFIYSASDGQFSSNATVSLAVDSTVSGQVWLDSNADGIENNGETGMSGITVNLINSNGDTLSSATTDADGNYQLAIDPNIFGTTPLEVQAIIPQGYSATIPFANTSGIYSSIDASGISNPVDYLSGVIVNAGLVSGAGPLGSIGGEVWLDSDDNGLLDNNEAGLQAINVNLLDSNNNVVDSTSTDANGNYSFIGLTPNTPYTVQFIAPGGYTFAPQNVGPPATSSSAGPNGDTNPITLTPGQNDTTVNAGLYGSAPIVYQTNEYMTAENDSYTGMDFTAAGYDPNNQLLTPVIVQGPSYGSLVYNTSTGLYDYTAAPGYTGEDSFEFELSNGRAVSNVVTVQILAYTGILDPGEWDSFPALGAGLFDGNNGQPLQSSIKQGGLGDCWFVSAAAGLAQQNPNKIVGMIEYNAAPNTYTVRFPNEKPTTIPGCLFDGNKYSTANGDWLRVLEKAYGQMEFNKATAVFGWANTPSDYIKYPNLPSIGVEALTGNNTDVDWFFSTWNSTTRQKLSNAFAHDKVVTAQIFGGSSNEEMAQKEGLSAYHIYTVVAYNATSDQVRLRNPYQENPFYNPGAGQTFRGKNDFDNPNHDNNGYFWMSVSLFTHLFSAICYEK